MAAEHSLMTGEISAADIRADLHAARWPMAAGAVLGLGAAIFMLLCAVPQYRATMILSPTTRTGAPDISALLPKNASFAMEYVMQSFGPSDSSDFMRLETIMREASVAAIVLKDSRTQQGLRESGRYRLFRSTAPDTPEEVAAWLKKNMVVEQVGVTPLKRFVFQHPDSAFAVYMLQYLYETADNLMRTELQAKTDKRVAYLREALARTQHPDHRRVLADILMDQEQVNLILAVNEPFAAAIAEPAAAGDRPYWPRRGLILPAFMLLGAFAGYLLRKIAR